MHTRAHPHSHTRTHARTNIHTCIHARTHTHIHTHAHTHTHTHARTHTRAHTYTHARTYAHVRTHTRAHTRIYTHIHTRTRTHTHTHTHTHSRYSAPVHTLSISQATPASPVLRTDRVLPVFNFSNFYDGYLLGAIIPGFCTYTWMQFLKLRRRKQHVPPKRRCLSINRVENQSAIICPALPASILHTITSRKFTSPSLGNPSLQQSDTVP
jgi:hypothetical protein